MHREKKLTPDSRRILYPSTYLNPKWKLEISNGRHACLNARFCLKIRVGLDDMLNIYDVFAMILLAISNEATS